MKIAVLFPGQGSQFVGMGKEFVEENKECASLMELADSVCEFPLRSICHDGPLEELTRAAVLQPAVTVTNLICLRALQSALPASVEIGCYGGHSAGEYSALSAAGVIPAEDAIRLVERRGHFMEREGNKNPGGMRAVLGLDITALEEIVANYSGPGVVTIANHNTAQQIVISGTKEGLDAVAAVAEERECKVIPLTVSIANHSPLVADAVPDFSAFMDTVSFSAPSTPIYFNVSAQSENYPATIKKMMARQIASRVRWYELIMQMMSDGVDTFFEVGPKSVLRGMMRKIVPKGSPIRSFQFDTPDGLQSCLEKLELR